MKKICLTCNKEYITYNSKRKFCSILCRDNNIEYKNKKRGKNLGLSKWNTENKSKLTKLWWKNATTEQKEERNKKLRVQNIKKANKGENNGMWRGGVNKEGYNYQFNKELKLAIKIRDNYKCQICHQKKKILYIHHIDYNKQNNNLDNLITLCDICHTKTNSHRHDWLIYFKRDKVEKIKYDWNYIYLSCKKLSEFLKDKNATSIYGIPRGGVIPAVLISKQLGIPLVTEIKEGTVCVDEIVDYGITLKRFKKKYPNNLFICIHFNTKNFMYKNYKPDYFFEIVQDKYIIYPWEE